jgi:UDP-2,4-diacetamido-2,4,6-trideoxy-beta-L-altropyranose hydrolase
MRVAFRTDASDAIGTGHLMRCLTLADAVAAAGHECRFVLRDHPGCVAGLVEQRGHELTVLSAPDGQPDPDLAHSSWLGISQTRDAQETLAAIDDGWDWVVADHYALDHRWEDIVRPATKRLMAIDDLADREHACDLLLDQNLQMADRYAGLTPRQCRTLLGPAYALLRPEFAEFGASLTPRPLTGNARVLVYFGGIDPDGATLLALDGLAHADLPLAVDVVVGARNPHLAAIQSWCASRSDVTLYVGQADMPALMARAALAIGAAGATAWERCCLSLPTILLTIADNQRPGASALAELPAAVWLGDAENVTARQISEAVTALARDPSRLAALAQAARSICDGRGTVRVLAALTAPQIALRPATNDDCDVVHEWRNHPETRRHFHDPSEVALADHRAWFTRTLADPDRRLWIGESEGRPAGVIRFDRDGDSALVSIYLVPGRSGGGLGTALIDAGCRAAAAQWPELTAIDAEVLDANQASARAFAKTGFVPYEGRWRLMLSKDTLR